VADFNVVLATKWKNEKSGKEGTSYLTVGDAFAISKGGYSLRIKHAVTIVPGVTEMVLFPPKGESDVGF
jgi:hypothetical protein